MNILAIDSSGLVAGTALIKDDILVGEYSIHSGLTHSQTLLPMIAQMMDTAGFDRTELDAVAVSRGPGSFTGLRIGASTAKGLAQALGIDIIPVSSLEGLAYNLYGYDGIVCPIMDARRHQVYYGIYDVSGSERTTPREVESESADDIDEVIDKLTHISGEGRITFVGDAVPVYRERIIGLLGERAGFANSSHMYQRASSIAELGIRYIRSGRSIPAEEFSPTYLRQSQAERERAEKN